VNIKCYLGESVRAMLSTHFMYANILADTLEEKEAQFAQARRLCNENIEKIKAKQDEYIMKRGEKAIEYAVSVYLAFA
jgi:hypothetical protein